MINFTKTEYKQLINKGIKSNEGTLFKNPADPSKIIKTICHSRLMNVLL